MIRKSVKRFSLATNAERVCAEIMPKQVAKARYRALARRFLGGFWRRPVLGLATTRLLAGKLLPGAICGLLVGVAGSRGRLVVGFLGLTLSGQYRRGHEERTRKTDEDYWRNPHLEVPLETSP